MKINERTFRRILREEALRELTGNNNRSVNLGLTLSEVSALRAWSSRSSRLNEDAPGLAERAAVAAMESRLGRKIMIGLLKALKFIPGFGFGVKVLNVSAPIWQKAINFANDKFGVKLPISGEGIASVVKWLMPDHYAGMIIDELIALLSDMSDEEYQEMVKKNKKANTALDSEDATDADTTTPPDNDDSTTDNDKTPTKSAPAPTPAKDKEPAAKKKSAQANSSSGLPNTMDERQIRDLVRKELVRFHQ